ncbi:hypothetical protein PVAND_001615 [Polypedilum vanderplanki]|uniref:Uncharacterized protein n=1 Tax=Polypedilum vanderplanki TaxID=319348 RepID=A0A9J6BNG3_POLVA|nr:hypothetical protein PVAND_001615 [Polypedilum vanderplanki]
MHGILTTFFMSTIVKISYTCENSTTIEIPEDFIFSASTSAYQIEGAWNEDGKSPSVWDTYTHNHPEKIADHSNGDIAADSYHFYKKDVEALKSIGFKQYRFSISWPRVIINGTKINQKGIDYYNNLINELISNGIQPAVTMYHWDIPQYLQDLGGFANPIISQYFEFYANVLFTNFGDRVKIWMTFNEPLTNCIGEYGEGRSGASVRAPGVGEYLCGHHVLISHANVYHLYKEKFYKKQKGEIGISLNLRYNYPKDEVITKDFVMRSLDLVNGWFLNPIFSKNGGYPEELVKIFEQKSIEEGIWSRLPIMSEELKKKIKGTADFLGVNYYTSRYVAPITHGENLNKFDYDTGISYSMDKNWYKGITAWAYSVPDGLHDLLIWIREKYENPKIMITENGWTDSGEMNDFDRIKYIKDHLAAVLKAKEENCNIIGYTVWSLIDNFEWSEGYTVHLGIFAVNMSSPEKERIPKRSARFLKDLIANKKFEIC